MGRKKSVIPGFSLNRALGITSAKQKIARATGIPTTKQGRKRKMQSHLWTAAAVGVASALSSKPQPSKPVQTARAPAVPAPQVAPAIPPEDMYKAAVCAVVEEGEASVALLQRKLRIGYAQAARLIDEMEENGVVGRFEGSKPRAVLVTSEQVDMTYSTVQSASTENREVTAPSSCYDSSYSQEPPGPKPFYKKWWFWALAVIVASNLINKLPEITRERNQQEAAQIIAERNQQQAQTEPAVEPEDEGYTEEEQAEAAREYYEKIGYDPTQEEPTEVAPDDGISYVAPVGEDTVVSSGSTADEDLVYTQTYVLNTSTHKFHRPGCSSVGDIKPENYSTYTGTRESVRDMGYQPCGRCDP